MTGKKLSDADKREILNLYRQTGETTSTLAERYSVSNSTISRFLKNTLPEEEYETLIAAKRAARTPGGEVTRQPALSQSEPEIMEVKPSPETVVNSATRRRHSSTALEPQKELPTKAQEVQLELLDAYNPGLPSQPPTVESPVTSISSPRLLDKNTTSQPTSSETPVPRVINIGNRLDEDQSAEASVIAQMLGEELLDDAEDLADLDDNEDLEDLDDDDDLDDYTPILKRHLPPVETFVRVLPLSAANLPKTCYLVIDRASELITRPLRDFGDLGEIPNQEFQQRTLPVFDNHRVARRFSSKRDRVIKVPDSKMLQKARSQLQAKGITRLLVDGQVYSLST